MDEPIPELITPSSVVIPKEEPKELMIYKQSLCEIDLHTLQQRLGQDRHFVNAFRLDMTPALKQKIDFVRHNRMNMICLFYGLPGSSKSYSALSFAKAIDPTFNVEINCWWDLRKFIDDLPNIKDNTCHIIDEVARNWGEGSFRVLNELNTVFETVRKRQIYIIVCTPRYFYSPTWSFCFEGIPGQISFELEKSRMAIQTGDRKTLGFVLFNSPLNTIGKSEIDKYEAKKDSFLEDVLHKGGSWMQQKAMEVENSEFFKKYVASMMESGTMPSMRGFMICVDTVFPHLRQNVECNSIANCLLTFFEMGKYGDVSQFKKSRGSRRSYHIDRGGSEDKGFLR